MKKLFSFAARAFRALTGQAPGPGKGRREGDRPARLNVERLEAREVPTVAAPWIRYDDRRHDLVDRLIGQLLPASRNSVDFFQNLNSWIYRSLEAGGGTNTTHTRPGPNGYLADLWGACGARDILMREVAGRLHIPARRVSFTSVPVQVGHTITEVYLQKQWRIFDASNGLYFSRPGSVDPINIRFARRRFPEVQVNQTTGVSGIGQWSAETNFDYAPRADNLVHDAGGRVLADIQRTYFISQASGGDVDTNPSLRSLVNLDLLPTGGIGSADGRASDVVSRMHRLNPAIGRRESAAIGWNGATNVDSTFVLNLSRPAMVDFTVYHVGASAPDLYADFDPLIFDQSYETTRIEKRAAPAGVTFRFLVQSPGGVLRLSTAWGTAVGVDAYSWQVTSAPAAGTGPAVGPAERLTGDFNGDGRTDRATYNPATGYWRVGLQRPNGTLATATWSIFRKRGEWAAHRVGDFNGDGRDDIASYNAGNGRWVALLSDGRRFRPRVWAIYGSRAGWRDFVVGDFNGDRRDDVAAFNAQTGHWVVNVSTGRVFRPETWTIFGTTDGWQAARAGDFNGDGRADIASYNAANGQWVVAVSAGTHFRPDVWATYGTADGWRDFVVGDFNGDRRDDVAAYSATSGTWVVNLATGVDFVPRAWLQLEDPAAWAEALVGDLNGDGRDDLLLYHAGRDGAVWAAHATGAAFNRSPWTYLADPNEWGLVAMTPASRSGRVQPMRFTWAGRRWTPFTATHALAAGYVPATTGSNPLSPLYLDLAADPGGQLGTVNRRSRDLVPDYARLSYGLAATPVLFTIGRYGDQQLDQEYVFRTDVPRRVTFRVYFAKTDTPYLSGELFRLSGGRALRQGSLSRARGATAVTFSFYLGTSGAVLRLRMPRGASMHVDAIRWAAKPV